MKLLKRSYGSYGIYGSYGSYGSYSLSLLSVFLLTFRDLPRSFSVNRTGIPELGILGVQVKGKLPNLFDVGPLGMNRSCGLGGFWRPKVKQMESSVEFSKSHLIRLKA